MLNINKLALTAARRVVLQYKDQNKRLYQEYRGAYTTLKLAINNGWIFESFTVGNGFYMNFLNENGETISLPFLEYTERRVCEAFYNTYFAAKNINKLCFEN